MTAAVIGVVFVVVGILGFIPGVTTDAGDMTFAGHESEAMLFDTFQVSILHNLVHLAFGVAGLVMAGWALWSRAYLIGGGIIYLALWIYGMAIDRASDANFVPVNRADDWLHFGLGVGMVALGILVPMLAAKRRR